MEFSGVHLNLFNVFKLNIGKFTCQENYKATTYSKKYPTAKPEPKDILDLNMTNSKYNSFYFYGQNYTLKGLYIDIYV